MSALESLSETQRWHLMVNAAKRAMEEAGYVLEKLPGKGLSNVYTVKKEGQTALASIRTTRDRWIAFPPLEGGKKWKTLDDVQLVIVATVDRKDDPQRVEVFLFPASDVKKRFNIAYAARRGQGNIVRDNFGMWIGLDTDERGGVYAFGSGIAEKYSRIADYSIYDLAMASAQQAPVNGDVPHDDERAFDEPPPKGVPQTISDVLASTRKSIATIAGVSVDAVKLSLEIAY